MMNELDIVGAGTDSEKEDIDLEREIFPMGHYVDDREELIEQIFSSIKTDKLRKMLPPFLKDIDLEELKADCMIHLLGMSKKRILTILEGGELHSSSNTESDSDLSDHTDKKAISTKKTVTKSRRDKKETQTASVKKKTTTAATECTSITKPNTKHTVEKERMKNKEKLKKPKTKAQLATEEKRTSISAPVAKKETKKASPIKDISKPVINSVVENCKDRSNIEDKKTAKPKIIKIKEAGKVVAPKVISPKSLIKNDDGFPDQNESAVKKKKDKLEKKITVPENLKEVKEDKKEKPGDDKGINLLEILELEMRAEAIRALLLNQDDDDLDVKAELLGLNDLPKIENFDTKLQQNMNDDKKITNDKKKDSVVRNNGENKEKVKPKISDNNYIEIDDEPNLIHIDDDDDDDDIIEISDISPPSVIERETLKPVKIRDTSTKRQLNRTVVKVPGCQDITPERPGHDSLLDDVNSDDEVLVEKNIERTEPNWNQRWLESTSVKRVVTTSKICANIRKRMKMARIAKQKDPELPTPIDESTNIQGSVGEYYMLSNQ